MDGKPIVSRKKINRGQGKISSYYTIHPLSQLAKFGGQVESINHKSKDIEQDLLNTPSNDELITTNSDVIIITNNNQLNNNNTVSLNSNTAIKLFQSVYYEVYGVNYVVSNYGREGKLIKDKVLTPHPELAAQIIETAVRVYGDKFKNPKFPRPTISMFSWIVNQIVPMIEEEKELQDQVDNSAEAERLAEEKMLAELKKMGVK